jgi:hypothetical protein
MSPDFEGQLKNAGELSYSDIIEGLMTNQSWSQKSLGWLPKAHPNILPSYFGCRSSRRVWRGRNQQESQRFADKFLLFFRSEIYFAMSMESEVIDKNSFSL